MMAHQSHNPEDRPPWPELGDLLRSSVERIRQAPPPPASLERALGRARRLGEPPPRLWLLRRATLLATSAVAASLLVGLGLVYDPFGLHARPRVTPADDPASARASQEPVELPPYRGLYTVEMRGGLTLSPGRVWSRQPGGDYPMSIGVGEVGSHWGVWEQVRFSRDLVPSVPRPDRKMIESYLRHQPRSTRPAVSSANGPRPLRQARITQAGGGRELQLQGMKINVRVEGPRACTLIDHVFRNRDDQPLTGTFEMALPDGASPSYFALFPGNKSNPEGTAAVWTGPKPAAASRPALPTPDEAMQRVDRSCWGAPKVGCVVPPPRPHEAPHEADEPAPSAGPAQATLRGPIGTILPQATIRVLVAYEELLPVRDGRLVYGCPLPEAPLYDLSVTVQAGLELAATGILEPGEGMGEIANGLVTYRRQWKREKPGDAVTFTAAPPDPAVQATSGRHGDDRYLLARLRPEVPAAAAPAAPFARHAVFLLDTSAGESETRLGRAVKLLSRVLETDPTIEQFNVLTFSTGASWLEPGGWLPNTRQGRDKALARLDGVLLEGATDLSAAVAQVLRPAFVKGPDLPMHCFLLSEGRLSGGETDLPTLAARLEAQAAGRLRWHCYQLGLGEENAELFGLLTRGGGGVYRCLSEKDVPAAAEAHRRPCLTIDRVAFEGRPEAADVLVAGRRAAVYPGGDLVVAARFDRPGPTTIVVEGRVAGRKVTERFPVEVRDGGQLAGRGWAELAVSSLLALNDPRLGPLALEIARQFRVVSRVSALGLTSDPRHWAPEEAHPWPRDLQLLLDSSWESLGREVMPRQRRDWLAAQVDYWVPVDAVRRDLRELVERWLPDRELALPEARLEGGLTRQADADLAYLAARSRDRRAVAPLLDEAERRQKLGQTDSAARVLCGLIEEHPGDAAVARLVAYRLVGMGRPALAARLMAGQVEQHPLDPAAHRALAVALDDAGQPGRAALHFEVALTQLGTGGDWAAAAREDYLFLLARRAGDERVSDDLRRYFREQRGRLDRRDKSPLLVSLTWNTTASDVALRVTDERGHTAQAPPPAAGVAGMRAGPRRVALPSAGRVTVEVELTRAAPEQAPMTFVSVQTLRDAGTPRERVETKRLVLRKVGDRARVE